MRKWILTVEALLVKKMENNFKMLVLDLDGTLLNSQKIIEESTIKVLRDLIEKGCYVVFASGRRKENLIGYVRSLYRNNKGKGGFICCDGCYIYNLREELVHQANLLSGSDAYDLWNAMKNNISSFACYTAQHDYVVSSGLTRIKSCIKALIRKPSSLRTERIGISSIVDLKDIEKIVIHRRGRFTDEECLSYSKSYNVVKMSSNRIEIQHKGVNKFYAVNYLRKILGIDMKEICYIGDDENDRCMFESEFFCVAMGNASDTLKNLANMVIDNNDCLGVEKYICSHILRGIENE